MSGTPSGFEFLVFEKTHKTQKLRVEVTEVAKGSKWDDLAVSEIRFYAPFQ